MHYAGFFYANESVSYDEKPDRYKIYIDKLQYESLFVYDLAIHKTCITNENFYIGLYKEHLPEFNIDI